MKKMNSRLARNASRSLRLETLENREMLSATPFDLSSASAPAAYVAQSELVNPVLELVGGDSDLTFAATDTARQYTMSWAPIEDASSYIVYISRDEGATWTTYRKDVETTSCDVVGLYPGKSYSYRVYGVNANGKRFGEPLEGTFAPISLTGSSTEYHDGDTLSVEITGAENSAASIQWFKLVDGDEVEIEEAAGNLEYAPGVADYDVKVVATGRGDSRGSNSEVSFVAVRDVSFDYDAPSRQATLSWGELSEAERYRVTISRNGGESWANYASVSSPSCTVKGVYVGTTYEFQVYAYDATGAVIGFFEGSFAPVGIESAAVSYSTDSELTVTIVGSEDADATLSWQYLDGDAWTTIEGATDATLTVDATLAAYPQLRVVATGVGASEGSSATATFVRVEPLSFAYDEASHRAQLTWASTEGAASYRVKALRGETWANYAICDADTLSCQLNGLYPGYTYSFRVCSYDASGKALGYDDADFAPIKVSVNAKEFGYGDVLTATVKGSSESSASLQWSACINGQWRELEGATGAELTIVGELANASDVKVVATGTGISTGSNSEASVAQRESLIAVSEAPYVTLSRSVEVSWNTMEDAVAYGFQEYSDGEWKKITRVTVKDGAVVSGKGTISEDGATLTSSVNMFNAGLTKTLRVIAINEAGSVIEARTFVYTNFGLELDHDAYNLKGDTLTAYTTPETVATYQWYSSSDAGATWNEIAGATDASYTISAEDAANLTNYRLIATNVETGFQSVVYAAPDVLDNPLNFQKSVGDGNVLNMTFFGVEGAEEYQIEYYLSDGAYPVWLNMTYVKYTQNENGVVLATHVNGAKYIDYDIRVRAVAEGVLSGWDDVYVVVPTEIVSVGYDENQNEIVVDWTDVGNKTGYELYLVDENYQSIDDLDSATLVAAVGPGDTSATYPVDPDDPTGEYRFVVKSLSLDGEGGEASDPVTRNLGAASITIQGVEDGRDVYLAGDTLVASINYGEATFEWYTLDENNNKEVIASTTTPSNSATLDLSSEAAQAAVAGLKTIYVDVTPADNTTIVGESTLAIDPPRPERPRFVVTTLEDKLDEWDDLISLREALLYRDYLISKGEATAADAITFDSSLSGGVIKLRANDGTTNTYDGVYTNAARGGQFRITSKVVIDGGETEITLDGAESGDHVFVVYGYGTANASAELSISNLTIANATLEGASVYGAAIYASYAKALTIENVTFANNSVKGVRPNSWTPPSAAGAAVYANSAPNYNKTVVSISDSTFVGNVVTDGSVGGGAVLVGLHVAATIEDSTFTNNATNFNDASNTPTGGGAIAITGYSNELTVSGSTFISNTTSTISNSGSCGGAIRVYSNVVNQPTYPVVTITDSVFDGNKSSVALYAYTNTNSSNPGQSAASITIVNSTFTNDPEAAILNANGDSTKCTITVSDSTITNNEIGVANAAKGDITITNSTVEGNNVDYRNTGNGKIIVDGAEWTPESGSALDEAFAEFFVDGDLLDD